LEIKVLCCLGQQNSENFSFYILYVQITGRVKGMKNMTDNEQSRSRNFNPRDGIWGQGTVCSMVSVVNRR
jgi:hypothetical protein